MCDSVITSLLLLRDRPSTEAFDWEQIYIRDLDTFILLLILLQWQISVLLCALCIFIFIHADHVVQSAWILFSPWMYVCLYVCMYVSALERKRLIGMT